MSIVTAITPQRRRGRYNLFVDGEFALALDAETLARSGLTVGASVTSDQLAELAVAALHKRALDTALRLLAYRPRSEQEIRARLLRHELPQDVVCRTIERLREYGYVNDAAFARAWVEGRSVAAPRGYRLLQRELRKKGIAIETTEAALEGTDELGAARQVAQKKARSLLGLAYPDFRNRLTGYLQRRGFGYDVIKPVVQELWQARGEPLPEDDSWDLES